MSTELAVLNDVLEAARHPSTPIAMNSRNPLLPLEKVI
jgi:hypothetical protein